MCISTRREEQTHGTPRARVLCERVCLWRCTCRPGLQSLAHLLSGRAAQFHARTVPRFGSEATPRADEREPPHRLQLRLEARRRAAARRPPSTRQTHRRLLRLADLLVVRALERLAVAQDAQVAAVVGSLAEATESLLNPASGTRSGGAVRRCKARYKGGKWRQVYSAAECTPEEVAQRGAAPRWVTHTPNERPSQATVASARPLRMRRAAGAWHARLAVLQLDLNAHDATVGHLRRGGPADGELLLRGHRRVHDQRRGAGQEAEQQGDHRAAHGWV